MKKNRIKRISIILLSIFILPFSLFAHSGRTDGNGGHKDNKNKSGLGSYHYHCGGYPAHLHSGGKCPYTDTATVTTTTPTVKEATVQVQAPKAKYTHIVAKFKIDGSSVEIKGISENGTTLVELRDLCNALGIEVAWNSEKSTITCTKGQKVIVLTIDSKNATIDNEDVLVGASPKLVDGKTLLPARVLAEAIGKTVTYNNSTQLIEIN